MEKVVNDLGLEVTLYDVETLDQIKDIFRKQYPDIAAVAEDYKPWKWNSKVRSVIVSVKGFYSKILFEVTTGSYQGEKRWMYTKAMVASDGGTL